MVMAHSQTQPDMFGGDTAVPKAHVPDPRHIRNRFIDFLAQMSAAETWPWDEDRVAFFRASVWPYLYGKFADAAEAADWRRRIEAEAARLDAAG